MRLLLCSLALAVASFVNAAKADEISVGIEKMLDVGWSSSPKARLEGAKQFKRLLQQSPNNKRVVEAYVLALTKQRRYSDAKIWIDRIQESDPKNVRLAKLSLWLTTIERNFEKSLLQAERFAQLINDLPDQRLSEEADFLGRVIGVVEGHADARLPQPTLVAQREKVETVLNEAALKAYRDARDQVARQQQELAEQKEQVKEAAVAEAQQERQRVQQLLDRERERLDRDRQSVTERRAELDNQLEGRLNALSAADQPLRESQLDVQRQARRIESDLYYADRGVARTLSLLHHYDDPFYSHQWLYELDRLDLLRERRFGDLLSADSEAMMLAAQRRQLRAQAGSARQSYGVQQNQLDNQAKLISRTQQRIAKDEKRLARKANGNSHRFISLDARSKAITTYLPFPIELEKQRLLEEVK